MPGAGGHGLQDEPQQVEAAAGAEHRAHVAAAAAAGDRGERTYRVVGANAPTRFFGPPVPGLQICGLPPLSPGYLPPQAWLLLYCSVI